MNWDKLLLSMGIIFSYGKPNNDCLPTPCSHAEESLIQSEKEETPHFPFPIELGEKSLNMLANLS